MGYLKNLLSSIFFIGLLSVFTFAGQAQTIGFFLKDGKKSVVIPFETYNNLIVVPVVLNNSIPLRFVLDTGVQTTILTERTFSDLLEIEYQRKLFLFGADGDRAVEAYVAGNISLELPGARGEGQVMLVLEEDYLQLKHYLGAEVHGILGYEIFRRFIVKIDFYAKELTFYEPSYFKPPRSFEALPISVNVTKPYFMAEVSMEDGNKVPVKLMIDTGASHSLLLDESSHPDLSLPKKNISGVLGRGLGGDIAGNIARVESFKIGSFYLENVIASFPDTSKIGEIFKESGRQGTMGSGILKRFVTIVDYYNNKIYLKKNRHFKEPFEFNMSGMEVMATGDGLNTFIIHEVTKDSPADEAGIQEGDTLKVMNGRASFNLELNDINSVLRKKPGKKIRLKIERDGEMIKKTFRLERLI